jgi:glyoxylase-like metal-dependent hydrolase (beta-lactamase superfamily II)
MSNQTTHATSKDLDVIPFQHPQGCRTWIVRDQSAGVAIAIDVHLDFVESVKEFLKKGSLKLSYVVDTHTHADHPSGSMALATATGATRVAHRAGGHSGVTKHPEDQEVLRAGAIELLVRHAPGHTPDHMVLLGGKSLFAGDTLLIGGVARTDFLGGDAGQLFDTLRRVIDPLPGDTVLRPGHDYQGRLTSTLAEERASNPWLQMTDRKTFVENLTRNPPPRPANMDTLLRWNRDGAEIPERVSLGDLKEFIDAGGAASVIDVRTPVEWNTVHIDGSVLVPLDQLAQEADRVRMAPAPRMLICNTGRRAGLARVQLAAMGISGLSVVDGGVESYRDMGGQVVTGTAGMSLERQVRIAAGSMVLLGTILAAVVNPWFMILPGFVGSGLIFAGVTDWCGMGLLLARMPWNQRLGSGAGCSIGGAPSACAASAPSACAAGDPSAR